VHEFDGSPGRRRLVMTIRIGREKRELGETFHGMIDSAPCWILFDRSEGYPLAGVVRVEVWFYWSFAEVGAWVGWVGFNISWHTQSGEIVAGVRGSMRRQRR
jgi:hypothetical protein